jgi:phosphate transport system substrate-binding protein
MSKGITTTYAAIGMIVLLIIGFAGGWYLKPAEESEVCDPVPVGAVEDTAWRSDTIEISGSTTVFPIAEQCAITFMNRNSGTTVTVRSGGSGVGYAEAIDGVNDIGMGSRKPKQGEIDNAIGKGVTLYTVPVAVDAVCVVVNPTVAAEFNLTLQEVGMIFSGVYTNWNEVKPELPNEEIYVVIRADPKSGTRDTFEKYCLDPWDYTNTQDAHNAVGNPGCVTEVETVDYSIGYVGYGFITDDVTVCNIAKEDGAEYVTPTEESAQGFTYAISRLIYFVLNGKPESGSLVDRFVDFVLSDEGQQIAESVGYVELPAATTGRYWHL